MRSLLTGQAIRFLALLRHLGLRPVGLPIAGAPADHGFRCGQTDRQAVHLGKRFRLMTPQDHKVSLCETVDHDVCQVDIGLAYADVSPQHIQHERLGRQLLSPRVGRGGGGRRQRGTAATANSAGELHEIDEGSVPQRVRPHRPAVRVVGDPITRDLVVDWAIGRVRRLDYRCTRRRPRTQRAFGGLSLRRLASSRAAKRAAKGGRSVEGSQR
jgi:hypothetical protein